MNEGKRLKPNPIKRIGLNGGGGAREIVIQIATALGWKIHEDDKGVSAYGGRTERIADHCTYMQTWVDNGTWNSPYKYDVVIEDEPTLAQTQATPIRTLRGSSIHTWRNSLHNRRWTRCCRGYILHY